MINISELKDTIRILAADVLLVNPADIEPDIDLFCYGLHSITTMELVLSLEEQFNIVIDPIDIFDNQTLESLAMMVSKKMHENSADNQHTLRTSLSERE
jgi:acyl carrier protein